jgi:ankyrin repeat protein
MRQKGGAGNAPSLLLMMAAMLAMLRCIVQLLFSPHPLVCRDGYTALMSAAGGGHESIVRLLLEYRANVNAMDE